MPAEVLNSVIYVENVDKCFSSKDMKTWQQYKAQKAETQEENTTNNRERTKAMNTRLPVSNPIMWQLETVNVPPKLFLGIF
jgi:hypothetical protein